MRKSGRFKRVLLNNYKLIIISILIGILTSYIITINFFFAIVDGKSMENTLHDGDILIISTKIYNNNLPKYMDVVNIDCPTKYDNYIVKRIIGLPGDTLEIINNKLYINDNLINEPYIKEQMENTYFTLTTKIPNDQYFVMGDNRNISYDSRKFGFIDATEIQGKVIFKYCKHEKSFINIYKN